MSQNSRIYKSALAVLCILAATSINAKCVVKGCFDEICACEDEIAIDLCLWKATNFCYRNFGVCEINKYGNCEWRPTSELLACVKNVEAKLESIDTFSD